MRDRVFLKSQRLYLRPLECLDIQNGYLKWFDDEEVCEYNGHHRFPQTEASMREYIDRVNSSRNSLVLAVVLKENDKHIGNISVQNIDYINRTGEFAIIIGDKSSWGKGYSSEAGKVIIKHVFSQLNLNKIYCGTSEKNVGMQKLALKLGFKTEGTRRKHLYKNNQYNDLLLYGLLKDEFDLC